MMKRIDALTGEPFFFRGKIYFPVILDGDPGEHGGFEAAPMGPLGLDLSATISRADIGSDFVEAAIICELRAVTELPSDVIAALQDDPAGIICGKCGNLNLFADDLGWFYDDVACCKSCYTKPPTDR